MTTVCDESPKIEEVPDLIPARMLNEFAYCPRLAYLEWVQGEFADNLEVLEGRFGHRRVEHPSRQEVPEAGKKEGESGREGDEQTRRYGDAEKAGEELNPDPRTLNPCPEETIHTRSLMLSAPGEGLIATMDLVDLSAAEAIPVDYKRGRVPDVPGGAWEPEQVQLCAQGLVLRENGYHCEGGILYFIQSRRRVSVPFDEPLVERTRELIRKMRDTAAAGVIPPPLVDSPKCPRCSLVGICLPDETRLLSAQEPEAPALGVSPADGRGEGRLAPSQRRGETREVRRLLPARDDAMPLYVQEQGATIGRSGDELTVKSRQQMLRQVKLIDVSQVSVFGNAQITAQALRDLSAAGIPICHFSYGGWFHALTTGLVHKNIELRIEQFAAASAPARALRFARQFVLGKMKNCRTLLRRHLEDDGRDVLAELAGLAAKAAAANDAATLLGLEGMAAKLYFAGFARLLKGDQKFSIEGRNRRPPRDPVNALLSFVYAILVKELTIALHAAGFDPMLGFYHRPRYGRPSLALDLAEEFRPLIADSVVLTLINNGEVTPASFLRRAGAVALTDAGRRAVLAAFERRLDTLVTHPIFDYRISYRRVLEVQARLLGRALLGEIADYPAFCTR